MRVLLFSPSRRAEGGGVQRVIERLAIALESRGVQVVRVGPDEDPAQGGVRFAPEVGADAKGRPNLMSLPGASLSMSRLATILARFRPDIVNVHYISGATIYFLALRALFGFKLVLSGHGSDLLLPPPEVRPHLPRFLRLADAVTAVSGAVAAAARAFAPVLQERLTLIPNGVDMRFWSPGDPARVKPNRIVAAGRLAPVKGFDLLIEAVAGIPEAELVILGEGPAHHELDRQAARLGVAARVRMPGQVGATAVREELHAARLFAMPSRSEGMPLALLEAMACGCPVVAAAVGGVPEVVTRKSGILVPPEDAGALRRALVSALRGEVSISRADARRRAEAFSEDETYDVYARLFHDLAADRRSAVAVGGVPARAPAARAVARVKQRRRRLGRWFDEAGQRLVCAGLPPGLLGHRWVRHADAARHAASAGDVTRVHPPAVVRNPLPRNVAARDQLPADRGWWGFSFHDVPERATGATDVLTLRDVQVLSWRQPDGQRNYYPAMLDAMGRSLDLREIRYRPLHAAARRVRARRHLAAGVWIAERVYHNHSHWLTAHLPKIVALRDLGLLDGLILPAERSPAIDASLRLLDVPPEAQIQAETGKRWSSIG